LEMIANRLFCYALRIPAEVILPRSRNEGKDKKGQRDGETGVKLKRFLLRPFPDFPDIRYNTVRRE
jgi:hypothetical protein